MPNTIIQSNPTYNRDLPETPYLEVAEFFCDTIQGEGINTGVPSAFLRVQHCTSSCTWCFGIKSNRRRPRIKTLNDSDKEIDKVKIGDILLTFDEEGRELVETTVRDITQRQVTEWQEIRTEKCLYFITPEHPFFMTDGSLKRADQLVPGDEVFHSSPQQKISYRMKSHNAMFNKETVKKRNSNTDWVALGIKTKNTVEEKKKIGIYKSGIQILKEKDSIKYQLLLKKISISKLKEKNPNWKGGSLTPNFDTLKDKLRNIESNCTLCNKLSKLEVHHIDENPINDNFDNLTAICHKCHSNLHKRGYSFWTGDRKDSKLSSTGAELAMNGIKILSNRKIDITKDHFYGRSYGPIPLTVYNLTCSPHNTYIIDEMWVHNCDSQSVWRYGNPYSFEYLFKLIEENDLINKFKEGQHLVLTGGSPVKQQSRLIPFLQEFIKIYGFKPYIEIENECTLLPKQELIDLIDCWNNSPKLSMSGNIEVLRYQPKILKTLSSLKNSWFKFVVESEDDWQEIRRDFLETELIRRDQIILMPLGSTQDELKKTRSNVIEISVRESVRFSDRLHITIWDKMVGV